MSLFRTVAPAALVSVLSVAALPALADVTGPELWLEWQDSAKEGGQKLTVSSQSYAAGVMTLTGLTSSIDFPEGQLTVLAPEVVLSDQADGTVAVAMPNDILVEVVPTDPSDGRIKMTLAHEGLSLIASGDDTVRNYAYSADEMAFVLNEMREGRTEIPIDMSMVLSNIVSDYVVSALGTDAAFVTSTGTVAELEVSLASTDPDEGPFNMSYQMRDIAVDSAGPMVAWNQFDDPGAAFTADQPTSATMTHGGTGYVVLVEDPSEPFEMSGSTSGGGFDVGIENGTVSYGISAEDSKILVRTPEVSFPIEASARFAGLSAVVPMVASDTPADFGLSVNLSDLTLSKGIWSMFDELGTLPRDPATLILELSGKVQLFMNLYDPEAASGQVPGDVKEISVDKLQVTAAGAELTGDGAFTVDSTSTGVIPDAPKLVGSAELMLVGANALIDNLIKIGVLQPEDAMGMRMMMSMVARAGDAPDSIVSKIELTESGGLIANGMQLQ